MKTYIAYFDETGDGGVTTASSDHFVLTNLYMSAESWQQNYILYRYVTLYGHHMKDVYTLK